MLCSTRHSEGGSLGHWAEHPFPGWIWVPGLGSRLLRIVQLVQDLLSSWAGRAQPGARAADTGSMGVLKGPCGSDCPQIAGHRAAEEALGCPSRGVVGAGPGVSGRGAVPGLSGGPAGSSGSPLGLHPPGHMWALLATMAGA